MSADIDLAIQNRRGSIHHVRKWNNALNLPFRPGLDHSQLTLVVNGEDASVCGNG